MGTDMERIHWRQLKQVALLCGFLFWSCTCCWRWWGGERVWIPEAFCAGVWTEANCLGEWWRQARRISIALLACSKRLFGTTAKPSWPGRKETADRWCLGVLLKSAVQHVPANRWGEREHPNIRLPYSKEDRPPFRDSKLTAINCDNFLPFRFSLSLQNKVAEDHLTRTDLWMKKSFSNKV